MALPPVDGGSGNVNGDFKILSQEPSILVQAGGKVVEAVTVSAMERAFAVQFGFTVPHNSWMGQAGSGSGMAETYTRVIASYIQEIAQAPHVVAIYGAPDTDLNGLLHDYLFVTVGIEGTDSTAEVRILQDSANSVAAFKKISDAYDQLVAIQNSGG